MKHLEDLYDEIEKENIVIQNTKFEKKKAGIATDGTFTMIAFDYSKIEDSKEEKLIVAEELAHYQTGAFYKSNSPFANIEKAEYTAKKHAINQILPYEELKNAIENKHLTTTYELSEYFNLPEHIIAQAYFCFKNIEGYNQNPK